MPLTFKFVKVTKLVNKKRSDIYPPKILSVRFLC